MKRKVKKFKISKQLRALVLIIMFICLIMFGVLADFSGETDVTESTNITETIETTETTTAATEEISIEEQTTAEEFSADDETVEETTAEEPSSEEEETNIQSGPDDLPSPLIGSGTESLPYIIATPEDFAVFAYEVNNGTSYSGQYIHLTGDVDISKYNSFNTDFNDGRGWNPIGTQENPFKGTFDGNGFEINGLYINDDALEYAGLFGYVDGATIKNAAVTGINIVGGSNTGGLIGYMSGGTVTSCYAEGSIAGGSNIGGLVGYMIGGIVTSCYTKGSITGFSNIGGILGGGLGTDTINLTNCYSTDAITGFSNIGGILGGGLGNINVTNCAALNPIVSGDTDSGRISGGTSINLSDNRAYNILWEKNYDLSAWTSNTADGKDGEDMTAEQIASAESWSSSGWDESVWDIADNSLPILSGVNGQDGAIPEYMAPMSIMSAMVLDALEVTSLSGSGTSANPYKIYSAEELEFLARMINSANATYSNAGKYYKLMNDIDLSIYGANYNSGKGWTPIGKYPNGFAGNFDGDNYKISGLYINNSSMGDAGLFGYVHITGSNSVTLQNIGLTDIDITANNEVGGLVGYMGGGTITVKNCYTKGSVKGINEIGGLVGCAQNENSGYTIIIEKSYSTCSVICSGSYSEDNVGGILGAAKSYTSSQVIVRNCYSTGIVTTLGCRVGGIIGNASGDGGSNSVQVLSCYSTGEIKSSSSQAAGIVGMFSGNILKIDKCAALNPKVSGYTSSGTNRIVYSSGTTPNLTNNYAYDQLLNYDNSYTAWNKKGLTNLDGADMTAAQAVTPSFWTSSPMSWDGTSVWELTQDKLPVLKGVPGQNGKPSFGTDGTSTYEIALSESGTYNFPSLESGYTTADFEFEHYKIIQVTNKSSDETGPVTITLSGTDANAFTVTPTVLNSIAAAEWFEEKDPDNERSGWTYSSAALTISPKTGLALNSYTATVTVTPSNSRLSPKSFTVKFTVKQPAYQISISPSKAYQFPSTEKNYGAVWAEQNKLTVTVRNEAASATGLLNIVLTGKNAGDFELLQTTIPSIGGNSASTFTVKPRAGLTDGVHNAILTVKGDDVKSRTLNLIFTVHTPNITHVESYLIDERDEKSVGNGANIHEWTNILNKSAVKTSGSEDKFDITMSVQGSQIVPPVKPAIVVMILDTSGSMNNPPKDASGSAATPKIDSMKNVASEFAYNLLSASSSNYLAVASFATDGIAHKRSNGKYFYSDKSDYSYVTDTINRLQAVGGTNTQGGLLAAYKILREGLTEIPQNIRDEAEYYIILMSDGGANYYYTLGDSSITASQSTNWTQSPGASFYTVSNINSVLNGVRMAGGSNGIGGSGNASANGHPEPEDGAQEAAMKAQRLILGTLGAGTPPTVKPHIYTVGFDMKSDYMTTKLGDFATNSQYVFHANDISSLSNVYTQIANQLTSPTIDSGSIITDKLSQYFEFDDNWFVKASIGSTTYNSAAAAGASIKDLDTLEWVLGQVVTKDVTASITFRIKAKPVAYSETCSDGTPNGIIPTNGDAKLIYWNILKQKQGNEDKPFEAEFTSPTVHVQSHTVIIDKLVNEEPYVSGNPAALIGEWVKLAEFDETGKQAAFKITVTNISAIQAIGVKLTDIMEKTGVSAPLDGTWYIGNAPVVNPTLSTFNVLANGSVTFYYITETLNETGAYTNTAAIVPGEAYKGGGNSSSAGVIVTEPLAPEDPPILSITKTVYKEPYATGMIPSSIPKADWLDSTIFYGINYRALFKITIANSSLTASAANVIITDELTEISLGQMPSGSWNGINPTITAFGVPANSSVSFYYISPNLNQTGEFINTATIVDDPAGIYKNDDNYSAQATVIITDKPILSIDKSVYKYPYDTMTSPDPSSLDTTEWIDSTTFDWINNQAIFKITITNSTSIEANSVKLTDVFKDPADLPISGAWYIGNSPVEDPTQHTFAVPAKSGGVNGSVTFYYISAPLNSNGIYINTAAIVPDNSYNTENGKGEDEATVTVDYSGGPKLPETGSKAIPFAATGIVIMCIAMCVLIYRKKKESVHLRKK